MPSEGKKLRLSFHGRIIDHLGIQMYQSPVAAVAELISNAWDADAESVEVTLPEKLDENAEIVIKDNGLGMTFDECQKRYLNIGYCRRGNKPDEESAKGRPILGRKGIGKFAGFGIASEMLVSTVSASNGEKTVFALRLNELRSQEYVAEGGDVDVQEYAIPDPSQKANHGTIIRLRNLTLGRRPSPAPFSESMARRFLLLQWAEGFRVSVNGGALPQAENLANVQFSFPRDYQESEKPTGLTVDANGWGKETLANGKEIRWRVCFLKAPVEDEELRGISVFANVKLAQRPFFFNLAGGLGGQHGQEYMAGQVRADFIDQQATDLIATERQRVNWDHPDAIPLEKWGQDRVKQLLRIWRDRRGESRRQAIEAKVAGFAARLDKLTPSESKVVKKALAKLGSIPSLSDEQFEDLGDAIVTASEQGRLKELISELAAANELTEGNLLNVLVEEEVLTALNIAEAVKTKILTVAGLKERIQKRELENAVRDYIAKNPWLIDPKFQTYRVESSLRKFLDEVADKAKIPDGKSGKRVDLALASGDHLIVIEFMRPGLKLDLDHLNRYDTYFRTIRANIEVNTAGAFRRVTGLIVADELESDSVIRDRIKSMANEEMFAMDWPTLFRQALVRWEEFLRALASRSPRDERLDSLLADLQ